MTYSFTTPNPKPAFTLFTKMWFALFGFGIIFIFAIYSLYLIKLKITQNSIEEKKEKVILIQEEIDRSEKLYDILINRVKISKTFKLENNYSKDSLKNLLDIVSKSNGITLDQVSQNEKSLKLSGITPTKEMFALLIETPLKSIFDESHTSYYPLNNGWYRFICVNKMRIYNER